MGRPRKPHRTTISHLPNGTVRARYVGPDGRWRTAGTFATEPEAELALARAIVALADHEWVDAGDAAQPFGPFATRILSQRVGLAPSTRARDENYYDNYIAPTWATTRLCDIDEDGIETWLARLAEERAPETVKKAYQLFAVVIRKALRRRLLVRSPLPERPCFGRLRARRRDRALTRAEIELLAAAIDERYRALVYLGAYCGLRIGELAALRVDDIDFVRCRVRVDEGLTDVAGHLSIEMPKTLSSVGTVPMPDVVAAEVRAHLDEFVVDGDRSALLFAGPNGAPLRPTLWRKRVWHKAVSAAGLRDVIPHDLRHTAIVWWIDQGFTIVQVAEWARHANTEMIHRRYGDRFRDAERDAAALDRLNAALADEDDATDEDEGGDAVVLVFPAQPTDVERGQAG